MALSICRVRSGAWQIFATLDAQERSFIDLLEPSEQEAARIAANLDRIATHGPRTIPIDRNHLVNEEHRIFQLRVNDYRILYFYDQDKVVICCHAFRKRSQKTPSKDLSRAIRIRNAYLEAKQQQQLTEIDQ